MTNQNYQFEQVGDRKATFERLTELGLLEDPFVDSSDPRFLYLGELNTPIYKAMIQGVDRRKGLLLATGDPGLGKTILAQRLYTVLSNQGDVDVAYIPNSRWESKFSALKHISSAFPFMDIPSKRSYDAQLEELKKAIVKSYNAGRNVVIILDDAQNLKPDDLTLIHELYNFSKNEKTVQTILFGQPETVEVVRKNKAVWSRVYQRLALFRLDDKSTVGLVNFRVSIAGRAEPLIDNTAYLVLDQYANGIPRDIVAACSQALNILIYDGGSVITKEIMEKAIEGIGKRD